MHLFSPSGQGGLVTECSSITNITTGDVDILINTTGTPCFQCLDSNGHVNTSTVFFLPGYIMSIKVPPAPGLAVGDGMLVVFDTETWIPAGNESPFILACQAYNFIYPPVRIFSNSTLPL